MAERALAVVTFERESAKLDVVSSRKALALGDGGGRAALIRGTRPRGGRLVQQVSPVCTVARSNARRGRSLRFE